MILLLDDNFTTGMWHRQYRGANTTVSLFTVGSPKNPNPERNWAGCLSDASGPQRAVTAHLKDSMMLDDLVRWVYLRHPWPSEQFYFEFGESHLNEVLERLARRVPKASEGLT